MAELEELIENGGEDTTGYNTEKEVNSPDIGENEERKLIPLNWNGSNWVITDEENWEYDYKNKQWANAMLSDGTYGVEDVGQVITNIDDLGSMFVWVPRFAYSIKEYGVAKKRNRWRDSKYNNSRIFKRSNKYRNKWNKI